MQHRAYLRVYAARTPPIDVVNGSQKMPELPEIETIRRKLVESILDGTISGAKLLRRDVLRDTQGRRKGGAGHQNTLLENDQIKTIERMGKQLYLEGSSGKGLLIRLGMSGKLIVQEHTQPQTASHCHASWVLRGPNGRQLGMHFIDPRRFGGLFATTCREDLQRRFWSRLGPDALKITATKLATNLQRTRRAIKVALLDQHILAGVGNIYADEALFAARVSPLRPANTLEGVEITKLARSIRNRLEAACRKGGTTLRDYRDPGGGKGGFASQLKVYGRKNQMCLNCSTPLTAGLVAARTTVWCPHCQR